MSPAQSGRSSEQALIPELGLRADVGEDECALGRFDLGRHRRGHPGPEMPGPRETLGRSRNERIDDERLCDLRFDHRALPRRTRPDQNPQRLVEISERRRHPPGHEAGAEGAEPRETELGQDPALIADQLVPFVDDDAAQVREGFARIGARQHQRQALGCGDEHARRAFRLPRPLGLRGVAGAGADRPGRPVRLGLRSDPLERVVKRPLGVRRKRSHRRDPEEGQAILVGSRQSTLPPRLSAATLSLRERGDPFSLGEKVASISWTYEGARPRPERQPRAQRYGEGLAGAGGGVDEARAARSDQRPGLALETKRRPSLPGEPRLDRSRARVSHSRQPATARAGSPAYRPRRPPCRAASAACAGSAPRPRSCAAC